MRAVVTAEVRYLKTPDGRVWTPTSADRSCWQRYLAAFDQVRVVARVRDTPAPPPGALRVDGDGVEVWPVPHYVGPIGYLRRFWSIRRAVRASARPGDAVILRVPSPIGTLLANWRDRHHLPYAIEVVGDPYDVFAPGAVSHPLRFWVRTRAVADLRRQARRACAAAYVTERALQARYPAGEGSSTGSFSDVELAPDAFVAAPRPRGGGLGEPTLVSVGSLEQLYKGIDTLLHAMSSLVAAGTPVRLVHVGDGRCRPELERLAAALGLADRVRFVGAVPPGAPVRAHLDAADLFVIPSRTEGLPRALIEAMARGLPAVGSTAGGIPELLAHQYLVHPEDAAGLALGIGELVADPVRLADASAVNLARSRDFALGLLEPARTAWYRDVRARAGTPDRPVRQRPARLVHVIGTLDRGGAETVALDLCQAMAPARVRQTFLTLGGREGVLAERFRAAGAAVVQCPLAHPATFGWRLWRCLRALRPDAVVSHVSLPSGLVLLAAWAAGATVRVARMHNEGDGRDLTPYRRAQHALLRLAIRVCATDVLGVTAASLAFARPRAGDPRYRVLGNAVNLDRLVEVDRAAARQALGLPVDAPVVVHIGRPDPEKNRRFVGEVHRATVARNPKAMLIVAGRGGPGQLVEAIPEVTEDSSVLLLGERDDIATILAASDVMVVPSTREGLPGVVIEALACGVPVVATDLPGLVEVEPLVDGLHLLSLSEDADRWAAVVLELCGVSVARRDQIRRRMRSAPAFMVTESARQWEDLCCGPW